MKYLLTLVALGAFTLSGSAQSFEWNTKSAEAQPKEVQLNSPTQLAYEKAYNERQIGQAGIYTANAQGIRTTSGETYRPAQLTGSHPLLPVGTIVRVQNLENGRATEVRINDKGRECADCLLTLSQAAASQLGITYRGRVAVERTGFSNWNPTVMAQPTAYASIPAYGGVTRPVEINRSNQWESRGAATPTPSSYGAPTTNSPLAYDMPTTTPITPGYNQPSVYGTSIPANQGNYAVLSARSAPSVMSREVQPATVSRQPATYSRYPTTITPTNQANAQPRAYQPTPRAAGTTTYAPVYQQPVPAQQSPVPVPQATPPPSTVLRYQESRTVPAPTTYSVPQAYNPPAGTTARGVASNVTTAAPVATAYVVQLGAYNNESYAQNRVLQLQKMGLSNVFYRSVQKSDGQLINRVYAGTFASMAEAQQASRLIQGNYQIAGIVSSLE